MFRIFWLGIINGHSPYPTTRMAMAFSEKIKLLAKQNSAFRCCVCHKPFVEVHHITPQSEGGSDALENAAPLCASCHDLYGGNPEKRKTIKQMRDYWWGLMQRRQHKIIKGRALGECDLRIEINSHFENELSSKMLAIYHVVFENENFETSAQMLFGLVRGAQIEFPGKKRMLYLDIDGHRNEAGGFDADMFELIQGYTIGFLLQYLTKAVTPLLDVENNNLQRNDIPDALQITPAAA